MRRLILTFFLLHMLFGLNAQTADIIVTKTGDIYEGYIEKQVPGKSLRIHTNKAILTAAKHDATIERRHSVMLGDLLEEYAQYFPNLSGDSKVEKADITIAISDGRLLTFKGAVLLEDGENIKFVTLPNYSFDLKWSTISASKKSPYDFSIGSGIIDRLILNDAEILEGQLVEQELPSGLFKFRTTEGNVRSFRKSEVQAIRFEPVNPDLDVLTQSPYCDRVILSDGAFFDGLILSKVFGKYITVLNKNTGEKSDINVDKIMCYEKYPNDLYQKPEVVVPEETLSELYVNGISTSTSDLIKNKSSYLVGTCVDSIKIVSRVNTNIVLKYRVSSRTCNVRLAKAKLKKERVFALSGVNVNKKGIDLWPVFSSDDFIVWNSINFQSNDGEYIVADVFFYEPGIYVIWVDGSDKCIPINIKDY